MQWDERPSIYEHVRSHVNPDSPGLTQGGDSLPDEERVNEGVGLRWAAGAMDGVSSHHMGEAENEESVRATVGLVLGYCENPTASAKADLYRHVIGGNTLPVIDPVIGALAVHKRLDHGRLYEVAHSFATEAPDREPVKFGLALLGLFRLPENEALFQTLGRHEEFTLYSAVALTNTSDDPERSLWTLARNVTGWGRIHVVERLAGTEDPEIKGWLLRDGYRNDVMYEYLAHTCATAGGLLVALGEPTVDRALQTSAGEILEALIVGGPAENIDDYGDGAAAVGEYLRHMRTSAETLGDFSHVHAVGRFLGDDGDWDARAERGWTPRLRGEFRELCARILARPEWAGRAVSGLGSDDPVEFHRANRVAEALGIDTWERHRIRLERKPEDPALWYEIMVRCDEDRIGDVLSFAEGNIPLLEIATGASDDLGLGLDFVPHQCLDYVLQELRRFPGRGGRLIEAGLRSPVVRNRNMAVAALAAWDKGEWPAAMREALAAATEVEPDESVRERMVKVVNGEPLDD